MKLHYREYGSGFPIIILHGLYGSSDNWVTIGKALSDHYKVYLIDQRNHGQSSHSSEHNYKLLSNDLLDFLNDHEIDKSIILGHSMGGNVAMNFVMDNPGMVKKLIVVDIAPRSYEDMAKLSSPCIFHQNIINAMLYIDFNKVNKRSDIDKQLEVYIKSQRLRQFLLKNIMRNKNNTYKWRININAIKQNLPYICNTFEKKDPGIKNINYHIPVLFIKGENSDYIKPDDMPKIKELFPQAQIISIPNSGHWVHFEQTNKFLEAIFKFIG